MIEIIYHDEKKYIKTEGEKNILELVRDNFDSYFSPCAKSGSCGRCRCKVWYPGNESEMKLACQTRAKSGMKIVCCFDEANTTQQILTECNTGFDILADDFISVDIGTTTLAFLYMDKSYSCMNPQRRFGSDVISRISQAAKGCLLEMKLLIREALSKGLKAVDPEHKAKRVIIAGNTTMIHLLMGFDCRGLGEYPFTPYSLRVKDFEFQGYNLKVIPGISAFVGGDILAGLFYIEENMPANIENYIFLDIGTNGELVLKKDNKFICTSTAAGPAFEGDATANVPGTDMLHMIAEALRQGVIDRSGLLKEEYFYKGYTFENSYTLTQQAVRDIQLAKAAIYCGVQQLLAEANLEIEAVDGVFLAGGFGYYMKAEDAFEVRLLPEMFRGKLFSLGNAALTGTKLYGLKSEMSAKQVCDRLESIIRDCRVVNLSTIDDFDREYIKALDF